MAHQARLWHAPYLDGIGARLVSREGVVGYMGGGWRGDGGWHNNDGSVGTGAVLHDAFIRDPEIIDQQVIGCVVAHHKSQHNLVIHAESGRHGAKEETNGAVVDIARLRQLECMWTAGVYAGGQYNPIIAARNGIADFVSDARAVGESG